MKNRNHIIAGTVFSLASIAVAIDHTRHPLPKVVKSANQIKQSATPGSSNESQEDENPCGLSPCSLNPDGDDN